MHMRQIFLAKAAIFRLLHGHDLSVFILLERSQWYVLLHVSRADTIRLISTRLTLALCFDIDCATRLRLFEHTLYVN